MAKFIGKIGFSNLEETDTSVYTDSVVERSYTGDFVKVTSRWDTSRHIHDDFRLNNLISVLADPYANENLFNMKYIKWNGAAWKITAIEVNRPRILITIGNLYNGRTLEG